MMGAGVERTPIRVLFLGDSITAGTRNVQNGDDLGGGYPKYAAERLSSRFPDVDFAFFNRGIWGNETRDLFARLKEDAIALNPDMVVLFVGVNDTLRHALEGDLSQEDFEKQYASILSAIKEQTKAKLLVIEPYLLMADQYNRAAKRFDLVGRIDSIRRLCRGVADGYMPLDGLFAELYVTGDAESYTADGLHPNDKGAEWIGRRCAEYMTPIVKEIVGD
ncbi:MAG: GDSL family lipase [Clostridia bacterium]|nr:GDSL family lipase [Clostridia bacterium]